MSPSSIVHKCHALRTFLHIVPTYGLLSQSVGVMFILSLLQVIDKVLQLIWIGLCPLVTLLLLLFDCDMLL